jgi:hypothetical protein
LWPIIGDGLAGCPVSQTDRGEDAAFQNCSKLGIFSRETGKKGPFIGQKAAVFWVSVRVEHREAIS